MNCFFFLIEICKIAFCTVLPKFSFYFVNSNFNICFDITIKRYGHCQFFLTFSSLPLNSSSFRLAFLAEVKSFFLFSSIFCNIFDSVEIINQGFLNILLSKNFLEVLLKRKLFKTLRTS